MKFFSLIYKRKFLEILPGFPVWMLYIALTLIQLNLTAQQFNFLNYSVGEGLAQSQVYTMIQDRRGFIWMGTQGGGVSRFDGVNFKTFTSRNDNLVNNYVHSLYEAEDGSIWIGTQYGLGQFDGLTFRRYLNSDSLRLSVFAIAEEQPGILLLGTAKGLYRMEGHQAKRIHPRIDSKVNHIYPDKSGNIWVATTAALFKITGETLRAYTPRDGLNGTEINWVTSDSEGRIWASVFIGGVHRLEGERFRPVIQSGPLRRGWVYSLHFDRDAHLWITTQNAGVFRYGLSDSTLSHLTFSDGLANNHVRCMLEDDWGNLWFGTSGGGVSKYAGQQFIHFDRTSGLRRQAYSVLQDRDCRIWAGNADRGLAAYENGRFSYFDGSNGFLNIKVKAMLEDGTGRIWFGTDGRGLAFQDDSLFRFYNGKGGIRLNFVKDIVEEGEGDLLVATYGKGIVRMSSSDSARLTYSYSALTDKYEALPGRIDAIHKDRKGRLWFGSRDRGLGYIFGDNLIFIDLEGGVSSKTVRTLAEDEFGYLWAGTGGAGVYRIKLYGSPSDGFDIIQYRDNLTSGNVYLLALDDFQNLWIGSEKGLDFVTLDEERKAIEFKYFGKSEGFVGIETCQNAVEMDRDGNLWFGTINGLTRYSPGSGQINKVPPRVSISEITLFFEPLQQTRFAGSISKWGQLLPGLSLPHDQNRIGFEFAAINHSNPEQVQYQWRLLGQDQHWSPPSGKSSESYSNLQPGAYKFQVRAANEDGVWSEIVSTPAFEIRKPFWQMWWFTLAWVSLGLGLLFLVFRLRLNQVRAKAERQRQRLEMEKDLLDLEQKALRLQMNPHFIFNALNSIQGHIGKEDPKTARYYLAKFSRLMRMVLENSREPLIPLEKEIEILENYLSVEQFSRGNTFEWSVESNADLDPEEVLIPPMMIQPFIENSIIHGVAHLSTKGHIEVRFGQEDGHLICTVRDNGIGRQAAAKLNSQKGHYHKSTALMVTQERLDIMQNGKQTEGLKSIAIRDLVADDGTPAGTEVLVRIPYSLRAIVRNTFRD